MTGTGAGRVRPHAAAHTEAPPRPPLRWGAARAGLDRAGLVAETAAGLAGIGEGATVVLACSGGPDSVVLAHLTVLARPDLTVQVVHIRHGLRDDAADAAVAAAHATALGLAFAEQTVHVAVDGSGLEAAARTARYDALVRSARQQGAAAVLIGHTADDHAETVVLNLARGSGIRGLAGIPAEREVAATVRIVRPLLRIRRSDVRAFLTGEGLTAVADPTNDDPDQRRARAREEVLPALARLSGGPGDPVAVLTRLADLARADADALDTLAERIGAEVVARWGPCRAVRDADLAALPPALASRVLRGLLGDVAGALPGAEAVAAAFGLEPGGALHIEGATWVTHGGGWLAAAPGRTPPLATRDLAPPSAAAALPAGAALPELDLVLAVDDPAGEDDGDGDAQLTRAQVPPPARPFGPAPPQRSATAAAWTVLAEGLKPARVRARRAGDRLAGSDVTLHDVFIEAGVPRALRDLVPVVVDDDDRPLWVAGVAAAPAEATAPAGLRLWIAPVFPPARRDGYAAA